MPAITLGLAEVEDRLRVVRRRLNTVTVQHSVYVGLTAVIGVVTVLMVLGLQGSASAFRAAAWCGAAVCVAAVVWGALVARQRWLDVAATAQLADRRAALTDRLVTLIDLRTRPRPAPLAPVLVAQLLALSGQWQPQRIVPRRVPRSVFALVAALLALASTTFMERRPPEPAAPGQTGTGTTGAMHAAGTLTAPFRTADVGGPAAGGLSVPGGLPAGTLSEGQTADGREASGSAPRGDSQLGGSSREAQGAPGQLPGDATDGSQGKGAQGNQGQKQPGGSLTALPDRLQEAIRRAFHAEPLDKPQQLAAHPDLGTRDPSAPGEDQQAKVDRQHRDATEARKNAAEARAPEKGTGQGAQKGQGKTKSGEQATQRQDPRSPNQTFDGNSPAAGDGSSPGGLMDAKGENVVIDPNAPKTFKLTITSFLHAMEQKGDQPRQPSKKTGMTGSVSGASTTQVAVNERQLNDDSLRKAEIPPEYEDIVRRVYSLRGDQ